MAKRAGLQVSQDLSLPVDAVTSTIVVYGGKGMGKTNYGAVYVEELSAAGLKWAALDPMGVWWGIRHSVDGKGNGIECLILGGAQGDIPIEPTGGAVVADLVADEAANVVIDISRKANGEMWSIGERIRFARDYGKQLYRRQGSLVDGKRREPMCQVIDEAARFIPQMIRAGEPDVAQCAGVWSAIVEEGRNVGLGVLLLTQRSARLNKDVAELADMMLSFRTVGPNSIEAVTDWLGAHLPKKDTNAMAETVRALPIGSALAVSPGWLSVEKVIAIRRRQTFDSSATPKPGEQAKPVRGAGAKPDLALYAKRMRETIERAKEDSVPELKKRIRELETMASKPVAAPVVKTVQDPALVTQNEDLRRELGEVQRQIWNEAGLLSDRLGAVFKTMRERLGQAGLPYPVTRRPTEPKSVLQAGAPAPLTFPARRTIPAKLATFDREQSVNSDVKLRGKSMDMLRACARMYPKGLTEAQVGSQAGMKRTGGTFGDYKSLLKTSGCILIEGGLWYATEEGMRRAGTDIPAAPTSTEEVLAMWMPKLRGKAKDILQVLVDAGGEAVTYEAIGAAVEIAPSGGTFGDYLSLLRTADLITTDKGTARANADVLFL